MPDTQSPSCSCSAASDHELVQWLAMIGKAPRLKHVVLLFSMLTICSFLLWSKLIAPVVTEVKSAWAAFSDKATVEFHVHTAQSHEDPSRIHVKTLDPNLLPRSSGEPFKAGASKNRLVFVGDIHGCREELEALLDKVRFDTATDHLVSVGDVVSKGPHSLGVIDLLRRCGASCVRGNHDDRLLMAVESLRSSAVTVKKRSKSGGNRDESADLDPVLKLAISLSIEQLDYLRSCPFILRIGYLKAFNGEAIAVHAGLVPGVALDSQDPFAVMNMRIIDLSTHQPSQKHKLKGSIPWHVLWNRYQRLLPLHDYFSKSGKGGKAAARQRTTVIYGHNAREGLQIHEYTKGFDTGAVKGGKLTALVVDGDGKQEIVQVAAKHHTHFK